MRERVKMYWQLALLLQILLLSRGVHPREECPKTIVSSCSDCIRAGPFCMWCNQLNFTKQGELNAARCDTKALLMEKGCDPSYIISPNNSHFLEWNEPMSKGSPQKKPIQLRPQEVKLLLRPGKPHTLPFRFKRAEDYPVDLYYLMDLSYSMKDDLENVKNLGENLLEALGKITTRARIGFGAFVDKTILPFTNINKKKLKKPCPEEEQYCQPAFGYQHVLSMTENKDVFKQSVSSLNISGNLDTPEGSLDAIMQAADKIGWGNSTRLLVLTTDAGFHMAGDGKLGSIFFPNDCKCHLGEDMTYSKSNELDYPSVGQVARMLSENNIQTIFAVTAKVQPTYMKLTEIIPRSEVGILSEDSKNVVDLIEGAYRRLSSKVTVTHEDLPDHITATYTSNCPNGNQPGTRGTCDNVGVDQEVEFNVTLMAEECFGTKSFQIIAPGFQEEMKVTVTTQCECDCGDILINHEHCNSHGNITCAICSCDSGYAGQKCECKLVDKDESELKMACQRDKRENGTECSGLGECVCGECQCHTSEDGRTIYGTHCECDDRNCALYQNKLCGGNGQCDCGTCKCNPDFEGSACQCRKSTEGCRMASDRSVCSGRGKCECNRCQSCQEGYKPPFCEECPGCSSPCLNSSSCIECLRFTTGVYSNNCTESCLHLQYNQTEDAPKGGTLESSGWSCKERDTNNCWMTFTIKQLDGFNKYKAWIHSERECPEPPGIGPIIGGVFACVALIGIVLFCIIISIIRAQDRREWKNFEQSRKAEQWGPHSQIFKTAVTTVKNPLHEED